MFKAVFDRYYARYLNRLADKQIQLKGRLVDEVLSFDPGCTNFVIEEERSYPGNPEFVESGYWKTMVKRYLLAGEKYCLNKSVLDTCCGLGWGSRIVAEYANTVLAFDQDTSVVDFCKKAWSRSNITWREGDALDMAFLGDEKFDVALGMETIEHFTYEEGCQYVNNIASRLKEDGVFIGTSYFPYDRSVAEKHCNKNEFHRHIFTYDELDGILKRHFIKHRILNNWLFIAEK